MGSNDCGQCGVDSRIFTVREPVPVDGLDGVTINQVRLGFHHGIACSGKVAGMLTLCAARVECGDDNQTPGKCLRGVEGIAGSSAGPAVKRQAARSLLVCLHQRLESAQALHSLRQ